MKKVFMIESLLGVALLGMGGWLAVPAARATDINVSPALPNAQYATSTGPAGWVANFYQLALMFAGVLAFGAVVYGGVRYLASAGNPSAQSEGKEWIKGALIGLLLLAAAYLILDIVNPAIVNLNTAFQPLTPVNVGGNTPGSVSGSTNGSAGGVGSGGGGGGGGF